MVTDLVPSLRSDVTFQQLGFELLITKCVMMKLDHTQSTRLKSLKVGPELSHLLSFILLHQVSEFSLPSFSNIVAFNNL